MIQQNYFQISSKILDPSAKLFFPCVHIRIHNNHLVSNIFSWKDCTNFLDSYET